MSSTRKSMKSSTVLGGLECEYRFPMHHLICSSPAPFISPSLCRGANWRRAPERLDYSWDGTARGQPGNQISSVLSFLVLLLEEKPLNFAFVVSMQNGFALQE